MILMSRNNLLDIRVFDAPPDYAHQSYASQVVNAAGISKDNPLARNRPIELTNVYKKLNLTESKRKSESPSQALKGNSLGAPLSVKTF